MIYEDVRDTKYEELLENQTDLALPERVGVLTAEINIYKVQAGTAIIEIGQRLKEAKYLLEHGQWTEWLKNGVDFSERTAQNFMRVADEYPNPQALAVLGYTKALALLALNPADREEFLSETHIVDGEEKKADELSTREFEKLVRERDEAIKKAQEAEQQTLDFSRERDTDMEKLKKEKAEAEAREKELSLKLAGYLNEQGKLQEQLTKAKEAKKKAEEKYKELKDNPAVAPEVIEQLKAEAEQAAKTEAEEQANERLRVIEEEKERLITEKKALASEREKADERAATLEKKLAMANPSVKEFQVYFKEFQEDFNKLIGLLSVIDIDNSEMSIKLWSALKSALETMLKTNA